MAKRVINGRKARRTRRFMLSYDTFSRLKNNLYIGLARGVGTAFGFTVLGAAVLLIMQLIPLEKIPFIGNLIRELSGLMRTH